MRLAVTRLREYEEEEEQEVDNVPYELRKSTDDDELTRELRACFRRSYELRPDDRRGRHTKLSRELERQRYLELLHAADPHSRRRPCRCDPDRHACVETLDGRVCTGCGLVLPGTAPLVHDYVFDTRISVDNVCMEPHWSVAARPVLRGAPRSAPYVHLHHMAEVLKLAGALCPPVPDSDFLLLSEYLHRTRGFSSFGTLTAGDVHCALGRVFEHDRRRVRRYRERWLQIKVRMCGGPIGYAAECPDQPLMPPHVMEHVYEWYSRFVPIFLAHRAEIGRSNVPYIPTILHHALGDRYARYTWKFPLLDSPDSRLRSEYEVCYVLSHAEEHDTLLRPYICRLPPPSPSS